MLIKYLIDHPLVSHAVLGGTYALALTPIVGPSIAALIVSVLFFGREAGQREHQLKRTQPPIRAWIGAAFCLGWTRMNWLEWLTPTLAAIGVAILLG
ncbi:MAG: hypothetical protein EOP83_18045 [Verrucomicrobiaceae bacterium]|nr:MAG: hypothetical protein EOP83_18045 [Verrucomicrobiaceae bacterium]